MREKGNTRGKTGRHFCYSRRGEKGKGGGGGGMSLMTHPGKKWVGIKKRR